MRGVARRNGDGAGLHPRSIVMVLSLATIALWAGLDVSFNAAIPASLFGIRINHDLAMDLSTLAVAGVFVLPLPMLGLIVYALGQWITRKPPIGLCRSCGYDLRATPDQCPECGAVPSRV